MDSIIKDNYIKVNAQASVGSQCTCPECNKKFIKKYYQQKFCCTRCKDNYHNHTDPSRVNRLKNFWKRVKTENENVSMMYMDFD